MYVTRHTDGSICKVDYYVWSEVFEPKITIWYYLKDVSNVIITVKNKDGIVVMNTGSKAEKNLVSMEYDLSINNEVKKLFEKSDSKIKINEAKNKKFYLPAGKYTITIEDSLKLKESSNFEILEPKK